MARKYFLLSPADFRTKVRPKLKGRFQKIEYAPASWTLAEGYRDKKEGVIIGYDGRQFMGMEAPTVGAINRTRSGLERISEVKLKVAASKNG